MSSLRGQAACAGRAASFFVVSTSPLGERSAVAESFPAFKRPTFIEGFTFSRLQQRSRTSRRQKCETKTVFLSQYFF